MRAKMMMPTDTLFGNCCTLEVSAELENQQDANGHEAANRSVVQAMVKTLHFMLDEVVAENKRDVEARKDNTADNTAD